MWMSDVRIQMSNEFRSCEVSVDLVMWDHRRSCEISVDPVRSQGRIEKKCLMSVVKCQLSNVKCQISNAKCQISKVKHQKLKCQWSNHYNQIVWIRLAHRFYTDIQYFFWKLLWWSMWLIHINIWKPLLFIVKDIRQG